MSLDKQAFNKLYPFLFASVLTLSTFFLLYTFRSADDNRLTSWQWTFGDAALLRFAAFLVSGIIISYMLARASFPQKRPARFLFLISFAVSVFFWREPEVIVDASRYFTQAKHLEVYGMKYFISEWGRGVNAWTDMPLIPFFYGLFFKLFGEARIYVQVFNSLLFSLTVALTCLIGETLWDEETGFLAGVTLLGIPYLYSQIPLLLVDVPMMFFITLSIYTFIKALRKGGMWVSASSIAIFCAVFSKYSAWLMLSVLPVIFTVYLIQKAQKCRSAKVQKAPPLNKVGNTPLTPLYRGEFNSEPRTPNSKLQTLFYRGISVALIAGALIAIVVLFKFDVIMHQIRFLREYQAPGLRRWGESFVSTFLFQTHPLITSAALYSVYAAFKKRDLSFIITLWLPLLTVLLQIRRSRYVMVMLPMLALMASYGLLKIRAFEIRRFIVYCIAASSIVTAGLAYLPFLQKMSLANLKYAGGFLNTIEAEAIDIYTVPSTDTVVNPAVSVPILDIYTDKDIYYHHDPGFSLPFENIKESPLRFTWEYKNPAYYEKRLPDKNSPVIVISNGSLENLPDFLRDKTRELKKIRVFDVTNEIFSFNPVVTIYLRR
ncbi:MAG: glycosyltransferase family 39 protein [Nitrospirae bacterium]|nr:glycosyltransferase family 39 protein [Nitrospirota bacterium]